MSAATVLFALLFYAATAVLAGGLAWRIADYARTPATLKIPTTPAPITRGGVAMRMAREVIFFESLFKGSVWTWLFGWLFHASLALVLGAGAELPGQQQGRVCRPRPCPCAEDHEDHEGHRQHRAAEDDDVIAFEQYLTFGRLDRKWKLKEFVLPHDAESLVEQENVDQETTRQQIEWYYQHKRVV